MCFCALNNSCSRVQGETVFCTTNVNKNTQYNIAFVVQKRSPNVSCRSIKLPNYRKYMKEAHWR